MKSKKPVTVWKMYDKNSKEFIHNHIEDGHADSLESPIHKFKSQSSWSNNQWIGIHAYLIEITIII